MSTALSTRVLSARTLSVKRSSRSALPRRRGRRYRVEASERIQFRYVVGGAGCARNRCSSTAMASICPRHGAPWTNSGALRCASPAVARSEGAESCVRVGTSRWSQQGMACSSSIATMSGYRAVLAARAGRPDRGGHLRVGPRRCRPGLNRHADDTPHSGRNCGGPANARFPGGTGHRASRRRRSPEVARATR